MTARSGASRAIRGSSTAPLVGPAAAQRRRSPPAWARSASARTTQARCAYRRVAAASSASREHSAVPYTDAPEAFGGMLHIGPMARTVADTALMMSVMMGPHPSDPCSYGALGKERVAKASTEASVRGKRFAWMPKVGNLSLDPDVATATREAVEQLQLNGAEVEEIEVDLRASADIIFAVTPPAFYAQFGSRLAEFAEKLDPTCRSVIERGADGLLLNRHHRRHPSPTRPWPP